MFAGVQVRRRLLFKKVFRAGLGLTLVREKHASELRMIIDLDFVYAQLNLPLPRLLTVEETLDL
jgi:hypothetical protein